MFIFSSHFPERCQSECPRYPVAHGETHYRQNSLAFELKNIFQNNAMDFRPGSLLRVSSRPVKGLAGRTGTGRQHGGVLAFRHQLERRKSQQVIFFIYNWYAFKISILYNNFGIYSIFRQQFFISRHVARREFKNLESFFFVNIVIFDSWIRRVVALPIFLIFFLTRSDLYPPLRNSSTI